jgi:alpha-D-ribose 1-methylphosphonate 5-triphosphate synthase subunit PhnH
MIVELPGFQNLIHDSQSTFKVLLDALSRPGTIEQITARLTPPSGLNIACAAACLTLLDLETQVWLQPGLDEEIKDWLLFHTGCRFTEDTQQADFAVIWDIDSMPDLAQFKQGTPVYPEDSTTLLVSVGAFSDCERLAKQITLKGAGINGQIAMPINLPDSFWKQWQKNHNSYPQGIDIYFFSEDRVIGLPRSSEIA